MSNNFPRLPVRFITENAELLKSQAALSGNTASDTDYSNTESIPEAQMEPQFRAPRDRNLGNVLFRRNPDGSLEMENAKNIVVDCVHKAADKVPLTNLEELVLTAIYPTVFSFVDPRLAVPLSAVHLRLAPYEVVLLQQEVASHLTAEMNYNAGLGGGGDPGRAVRRA